MRKCLLFFVLILAFVMLAPTVCAYALGPAVYYSPHPDDDTYGMVHSIRIHIDAGRQVKVVLLTDGENSSYYSTWLAGHPTADLDGDGGVDRWDFGLARRAEFDAAMATLGATVDHRGAAASHGASGQQDGSLSQTVCENIMYWYEHNYADASHKTVMKYISGNPTVGDNGEHDDHTAACNALNKKADLYGYDARFYKVYVFNLDYGVRAAPFVETANTSQHAYKHLALDEYYEIGRGSTPTL